MIDIALEKSYKIGRFRINQNWKILYKSKIDKVKIHIDWILIFNTMYEKRISKNIANKTYRLHINHK